jgi:hypothetical protein
MDFAVLEVSTLIHLPLDIYEPLCMPGVIHRLGPPPLVPEGQIGLDTFQVVCDARETT